MNKFQKVAYKLAKLEYDSGMIAFRNAGIAETNKRYGTKLKTKTLRSEKNAWYNGMKREGTKIESAHKTYNWLSNRR